MIKHIKPIMVVLGVFISQESLAMYGKAQLRQGYFGAAIGIPFSVNGDTHIPSIFSKPPLTSQPVYKAGFHLDLTFGYKIHKWLFGEAEFIYQNLPMNKINNAIGPDTVTILKNSNTTNAALFLNGILAISDNQNWSPYLGLGLGFVSIKNKILPSPPIPVTSTLFFTRKELDYSTLGYQAKLGFFHQFFDDLQLNLYYQYLTTKKHHVTGNTNLGPDGYQTTQKIMDHNLIVGIKYNL